MEDSASLAALFRDQANRLERLGQDGWTPERLFTQAGLIPDAWQRGVMGRRRGDQLLLCHRQIGKSTVSAAIALADACEGPSTLVLLVSRSMRQSAELFRKVKDFYRATQPLPLLQESALSMELANYSRIISLPGSEDTIVGYSKVRRIILDEAARIPDGVYYAVRPMLAMSGGDILALSTPFGKRGWFYDAWEGREESVYLSTEEIQGILGDIGITVDADESAQDTHTYGWTKTRMTAAISPRLSKRYLANERRAIPDLWFRQEWMCEFVDLGGTVFRMEDLQAMLRDDIVPLWQEGQAFLVDTSPLALAGAEGWR